MSTATNALLAPEQIAVIANDTGIDLATTGQELILTLLPLAEQAAEIMREAEGVTVTSVEQKDEMKKSRALRLSLRKVRVEVDEARKGIKEESLRRCQFIDGVAKIVRVKCEAAEERLDNQEKFAERQEAERRAAITKARADLLAPYGLDTKFFALDQMSEDEFQTLLATTKAGYEAKILAERQAEAARLAQAEAQRIETERVRAEIERLRKEAEAREAQMQAEREEAERRGREAAREAQRAREAKERAEAALRAEREAAERAERDAENARRRAARAPDRDKLIALSQAVAALSVPTLTTPDGKRVQRVVENTIKSCAGAILELAKELE